MSRIDQHAAQCANMSPDPQPMPKVQVNYRLIKDRALPVDVLAAASSGAALLATAKRVTVKRMCAVQ